MDETGTKRPRHHYRLTAKGKEKARKGWKEHLSGAKIPADLDSILRLADLAAYYRAPKIQIATFLKRAARQGSGWSMRPISPLPTAVALPHHPMWRFG